MSRGALRFALLFFGVVIFFYVVVLAIAFCNQRSMLYLPAASKGPVDDPGAYGMQGFRRIVIATSDGRRLVAWWRPPPVGSGVVVYFHGNGSSLPGGGQRMQDIGDAGLGVLGVEYGGYGRSQGRPSEDGLIRDGLAGVDFVHAAAPRAPVALFGESLGTGVALAVAERRPVAGVVLDSAFSSTLRVARADFPWLLPDLLMTDRWNSERRIAAFRAPVLAAHCQDDEVVPLAEAQRLARAGGSRVRLLVLPGCGHVQTWEHGLRGPALLAFADWLGPARAGVAIRLDTVGLGPPRPSSR